MRLYLPGSPELTFLCTEYGPDKRTITDIDGAVITLRYDFQHERNASPGRLGSCPVPAYCEGNRRVCAVTVRALSADRNGPHYPGRQLCARCGHDVPAVGRAPFCHMAALHPCLSVVGCLPAGFVGHFADSWQIAQNIETSRVFDSPFECPGLDEAIASPIVARVAASAQV